jgi:2-oxoisovalerate dehydrogenase E2 component (dihydrolipoyl transacylase)
MGLYRFRTPDIGEGIAEAEIVAWHVKVGDQVAEDQIVADLMTDKATVEICAPVSGTVIALHGDVGSMAATGSTLIEFDVAGAAETASVPQPAPPPQAAPVEAAAAPKPAPPSSAPATPGAGEATARSAALAAPAVRRRAAELGIDLAAVTGTGPEGRITHQDLDRLLAAGIHEPAIAPTAHRTRSDAIEDIKIVGLRRRIAEKMQESKRRIPHFAYVEEVDVTELERLRQHLNATRSAQQPKLTLLPFMITALVRVLGRFPQINATFDDEAGIVHRHRAVHLGMATQTPNGLIVPVIRHAETLDLWQLAHEVARLAQATRDNTAVREELSGSTITLTSLGMLGGIAHTPIINHPEVAIVGPNRIVERPIVRDGQIVIAKMMNVSSSFDHRVVDGADAAAFIQAFKICLEQPATLFIPGDR